MKQKNNYSNLNFNNNVVPACYTFCSKPRTYYINDKYYDFHRSYGVVGFQELCYITFPPFPAFKSLKCKYGCFGIISYDINFDIVENFDMLESEIYIKEITI